MKKTVYIAGPMSGYPEFNFPAFDAARDRLKQLGYNVISPADLDREVGFDPEVHTLDDFNLSRAIQRDVHGILESECIAMLEGWEKSKGACAEYAVAMWYGLTRIDTVFGEPWLGETVLQEASRITSGDRNQDYGHPAHHWGKVSQMWTGLFSDKLKEGAEFSPDDVGRAWICDKLVRDVNGQKRDCLVDMAGYARCIEMAREWAKDQTGCSSSPSSSS